MRNDLKAAMIRVGMRKLPRKAGMADIEIRSDQGYQRREIL